MNRSNRELTAGLCFNDPLPLRIHNTMSIGYVDNLLSQEFLPQNAQPRTPERAFEFNAFRSTPYAPAAAGGSVLRERGDRTGPDVVFGFRTKIDL